MTQDTDKPRGWPIEMKAALLDALLERTGLALPLAPVADFRAEGGKYAVEVIGAALDALLSDPITNSIRERLYQAVGEAKIKVGGPA